MRLLIIEDEAPMRTALVETLKAEGYRVLSAADGPSGLELACTEPFDLVLLDVMMPGLDGFAVCRELRKRGRTMPVMMLTAKGQAADVVAHFINRMVFCMFAEDVGLLPTRCSGACWNTPWTGQPSSWR